MTTTECKDKEIRLLKTALIDVVSQRDTNKRIASYHGELLLMKIAENKALRVENETLKIYLNFGGNS